jgi:hypothetical protein
MLLTTVNGKPIQFLGFNPKHCLEGGGGYPAKVWALVIDSTEPPLTVIVNAPALWPH